MSRKFLEARGGKLLLLAGTDRLDKELMIGQMQGLLLVFPSPIFLPNSREELRILIVECAGKYQLQVFPDAGHFIQEDLPARTAQILVDFYKRNDRSALVLPPKVADMQASAAMKKGTVTGLPSEKPEGGSTGSFKRS